MLSTYESAWEIECRHWNSYSFWEITVSTLEDSHDIDELCTIIGGKLGLMDNTTGKEDGSLRPAMASSSPREAI